MKAVKVLSVFGTRPEATKMVPLVLALEKYAKAHPGSIAPRLCVTAQHRELLDQVLAPFGIKPDADLNIMTARQSQGDVISRVLAGLGPVIEDYKPDILLVHGDTTTTFASALAAFHAKVAVGHVEAGLRTYDKYRPYPEEMNRKLTTALTDLHFAPTELAREHLRKENVPDSAIFVTGNTAIDLLQYTASDGYCFHNEALNTLDFSKRIILMTAHRKENIGPPMEAICRAVGKLAADFSDTHIIWPMHPNGAGQEAAQQYLAHLPNVLLTQALDLHDTHNLMKRAYLILTDSGGIQEEAPSFNVPVVVLREVTERPEGLEAGTLVLAGVAEKKIYDTAATLLTDRAAHARMAQAENPFGDGQASGRIIKAIIEHFKQKH